MSHSTDGAFGFFAGPICGITDSVIVIKDQDVVCAVAGGSEVCPSLSKQIIFMTSV